MSVTSATETFTEGPEFFDQDKYRSTVETSLEPDPIKMENDFQKPLSQRIIRIHSPTKSSHDKHRVDDVLVTTPSEAFRANQQQQWSDVKNKWSNAKNEAEDKYRFWGIILGAEIAMSAVGACFSFMDQAKVARYLGDAIANFPLGPGLLIAGLVGVVASAVFTMTASAAINKANAQIKTANEQIGKWGDDPVMKIGHARNYAHNQGFPYIYRNNLKLGQGPSKTALFHPLQVAYEFKKYFSNFCNHLLGQLNPSPTAWIDRFRDSNPVSASLMNYGLGYVPEYMKPVIEDFGRLQSMLDTIANNYDRLKSTVRTTARDQIAAYTETKSALLEPIAKRRDHGIATAEKEKNNVVYDREATEKQRQDAEKLFDIVKKECEATYEKEASPIIQKYNKKIKDAEKERETTLTKLDEQKSSQLGNNYLAARELLVRAKEAWDNKHYRPMNFNQYFLNQQTGQPVWPQPQPGYYQPAAYPQQPTYPQQPIVHPPAAYQPQPVYHQHPAPPVIHPPAPPPSQVYGYPVYGNPVHGPISAAQHFTHKPEQGG